MDKTIRALLVDDDEDDFLIARDLLGESVSYRFVVEWEYRYDEALARIAEGAHDVYLVDYHLGAHNGLELLRQAVAHGCAAPIILLTGQGDSIVDLEAMRAGAADYLVKGQISAPLLERSIRYALERARTSEALRESEERYTLAVRGANDGLWDWNLRTHQIYFSPRWKSLLGYHEEEISSTPTEWFERVHPEDRERLQTEIRAHLDGITPHFEQEHRVRHKDGNYRWMLSRGMAVRDAAGEASRLAGSQTDITARKRAEDQLLRAALHDPLTGLPSRALFLDRLRDALKQGKRRGDYLFAVLFVDVDALQAINERLGQGIGDELLVAFARRLEGSLRDEDSVARMADDEFAVLLDDLKQIVSITAVAERLQRQLQQPFEVGSHSLPITVTMGVALSATGYERPEDLLRDAHIAMYRAKTQGPGSYELFDTELYTRAVTRHQLEGELRRAIERQEFCLFYQPIVSLQTGRIVGLEALLRWRHPQRGLVPPGDFISVAEETGLIVPLGLWVMREACRQVGCWQKLYPMDPPLSLSVNLSGAQLAQPELVEQVRTLLAQSDLAARTLHLEMTESMIMQNTESVRATFLQLKDLAVGIHLDDFGTGYSSLSYLHRFPLDVLKIDRSFVRRLNGAQDEHSEIVRTILSLARNLKMEVVAEGVETPGQLERLRAFDCRYAQGYFFCPPAEGEHIAALLARRPRW